MLVINYNGNKPINDYFKYSVQGNNLADTIRFLVSLNQSGLVFDNTYHIYAKVQSVDDDFYDKVELSDITFNDSQNLLTANFHLESKHTSHKQIEVSLCCEDLNNNIVWQTQLVKVGIANGIPADQEIENDYPTVLAQLQEQIDELKHSGGGGGGSSEVEIKRVWLTYDDKQSIRSDFLGSVDENGDQFINDSTRIWVNIETTPISLGDEDYIKKQKFVIRLDYPSKSRNQKIDFNQGGRILKHQPQRDYGVGARSYTHSFKDLNDIKKDILLDSLIFIDEEDIKTNSSGEKYIHKKVSLFEFIYTSCIFRLKNRLGILNIEPIRLSYVREHIAFFDDYLDGNYSMGIPHLNYGSAFGSDYFFAGLTTKKYYSTMRYAFLTKPEKPNGKKLNPAFSCFTPLGIGRTQVSMIGDDLYAQIFDCQSPYFVGGNFNKKYRCFDKSYSIFNHQKYQEGTLQNLAKMTYMVARPRCAILNDNYETSEYAFLKTYPQATQQIRWYCRAINVTDENQDYPFLPIFRMLITHK